MEDINTIGVIFQESESYMMTSSGKKVGVLNPQPDQICLEDIAHSLSLQCRYNGQTDRFYSVAEHTVRGAQLLFDENSTAELIKAWLLHDASEAYVGAIIRPVKIYLEKFKNIEANFHEVIYNKYSVERHEEEVYRVDNLMCALEKQAMFPNIKDTWYGLPNVEHLVPKFEGLWGMAPSTAKDHLLRWFDYYFKR